MDYSKESLDRQQKIQDLKDAGVICYANNYRGKQNVQNIREISEKHLKEVDFLMEHGSVGEFKTAGRIMQSRCMGKLVFAKLRDNTGDIQICFMKDKVHFNTGRKVVQNIELAGDEKTSFKVAEKFCQVGDIIGVIGDLFLTKHGELTIFVKEFQILSKAVRPLPEKFHGLHDKETIYRQRYLDLITNEESYDRFRFRSNFVKAIREFYWQNDFLEIETPVLGNSASGAAAKPFITHHNDFDEDYFLRIAPETGLKKATVGRFERVFEIGKNYRNEGSDPSHMQEFTAVEHYAAWWNYEDNMKFTEDMFDYIFNKLNLNREVEIKDKDGNPRMVNFTTPWQRIDYIEGVKKASGLDVSTYKSGDETKLIADIKSKGIQFEGMDKMVVPTLIDYLYKKVLRPGIIGPAFVYNYPKLMQPLARQGDMDENMVEQFQLLVNGWEVLKAYSELVDPKVQQDNFDAQSGAIEKGDEEATSGDDDFVLAMEYAMPCQSGWGMGIDRIVSLLTEQENLRDVVLFPLMKSDKNEEKI
ncbi:MAG: lysine--tRNA ligase [Candidatus Gracilibacteria bacterium]|nr:lysine--tRNA ligase [Candidatus Gracilibacteria bacterium]